MNATTRFDEAAHQYFITTNGVERQVPSVTEVLRTTLDEAIWKAREFFLGRGRAIHACAALIARGRAFTNDPAITGQVEACRKFFRDMKPVVLGVEEQVYFPIYNCAGTRDLRCIISGKTVILDWKSSLSEVAEIQVGAYALDNSARWGMVVALKEDGTYKTGGLFKVERRKQEFLALLSTYMIRKRLGIETKKEGGDEN